MARTIAVQSRMDNITQLLEERGYKVVDMLEASRPGARIDAFLYTSNHPDIVTSYNSFTNAADVSFGYDEPTQDNSTNTVMLNIVGMRPEQAVRELERRLAAANR